MAVNASKFIKVIAVDLLGNPKGFSIQIPSDFAPINERVSFLKGDFTSPTIQSQLFGFIQGPSRIHAVLS